MPTAPIVSVIVCTRNRSTLLADTLESAVRLEPVSPRFELIVVDNGSTDDTAEVAARVAASAPCEVRVVHEPEIGLSTARNTGIREARGRLLAFLDDDAFPADGWINQLVAAFEDPTVMAAGGPVLPILRGELPSWFLGRFLPYFSVWDLGEHPLDLHYNEYPRGANIAFRSRALETWGDFAPFLGRKGSSLLSCEEIELCLRIERGGGRIRYVPEAGVRHVTDITRLTHDWLLRRFRAQGSSEAIVDWHHGGWRKLKRGLGIHIRHWLAAREERLYSGALVERCGRAALLGYARSMLTSPVAIPRYRARAGDLPFE